MFETLARRGLRAIEQSSDIGQVDGAVGSARAPADRRLLLSPCAGPPALDWSGTPGKTVAVSCPGSGGWQIYVNALASATAGRAAAPFMARGETLTIAARLALALANEPDLGRIRATADDCRAGRRAASACRARSRCAAAARHAYASPAEVEARVRRFVPMVQRAAWHVHGHGGREGMEIEDLVQAGMLALTEAAPRHSGPTEDGFAAYAKMRVRGAMFDLVRKSMPGSRGAAVRRRAYDEAAAQLRGELGRAPTPPELAARLGCSETELRAIEASATRLTSIEDCYDETSMAFASEEPDPFEALAEMDDRERLGEALAQLPERLQLVLQLFFVEDLNLTEIAAVLDISVPRVHQLRGQALGKLRLMLQEQAT